MFNITMRPAQFSDLTIVGTELSCQTTYKTTSGQQVWLEHTELAKMNGGMTRTGNPDDTDEGSDDEDCQRKQSLLKDKLKIGGRGSSAGDDAERMMMFEFVVDWSHLERVEH